MTNPGKVLRYDDRIRQPLRPGEKLLLKLSARERELILAARAIGTVAIAGG